MAQTAPPVRTETLKAVAPVQETEKAEPRTAHTSAELVEMQLGISADAPLCFSCGTKMQRAGSCYICEAAAPPAAAADRRG